MPRFIKDFLNIYIEEKDIRQSYGNEYADRFSNINPATGKKKISVAKIVKRAVGVLILAYFLIMLIRLIAVWYI